MLGNVVFVLSCLGIVQALFLCAYLFSLREKRGNIFLAWLLVALILLTSKSVIDNYSWLPSWVRVIGISGKLLAGPFLWLYGQALFEKKYIGHRAYLHIIPFALVALLCWAIPNGADLLSYAIATLIFLHLAVYLAFCWHYITTRLQGARLKPWYQNITIGVTCIWIVYAGIFTGIIPVYILGAVFFSFLIYIFSFLLLKRHVFTLEKYGSSPMSQSASKQLLQQVKELFETQQVYLENTITLKSIANSLSTSPRELSQVINEGAQMNFSEFVNQYRIAKAKALLTDPQYGQEKIETIAYDCGFGTVTSFNIAFKLATQMTPSQYRRSV
ncbi:AraC family transcriptional regulator [Fulvivirgaceae bacterium PWU5]|uniref:AraC family transcriptional regulator n=1 Tax=Dawidia cretensis TaxID=2782350 RepID=A0AAP2DZE8_9BACT|nr:AraC family transcriptional regulator [Dawidia cretensis]MBT1710005.1 AraC family transcriptional regulator [Dawidia cretensis]